MAPPPKPTVLQFVFHHFEVQSAPEWDDGKDERGDYWKLEVFPGGGLGGEAPDGENIDVQLCMGGPSDAVNAKVTLTMRDAAGRAHKRVVLGTRTYGPGKPPCNVQAFESRAEVLNQEKNVLSDGALVFDVVIQITDGRDKDMPKFQATNPALTNLRNLCESEEHADVSFKLKGKDGWTIIPAHKLVLSMNAPILAAFCGDETSPVLIEDTKLDVFRIILEYVYGRTPFFSLMPGILADRGKDVIEAADRYEIVGLKMDVESYLVKKRVVDETNVAEWLVFADSKTCPLLKEYALAFLVCRARDVMAHESSKCLKESPELMEEVVLAMSDELLLQSDTYDALSETNRLSVDELRAELNVLGLDVDGSKETLVSRLAASEEAEKILMETGSRLVANM